MRSTPIDLSAELKTQLSMSPHRLSLPWFPAPGRPPSRHSAVSAVCRIEARFARETTWPLYFLSKHIRDIRAVPQLWQPFLASAPGAFFLRKNPLETVG